MNAETGSKIAPIRTFKQDAAEYIKDKNVSLSDIVAQKARLRTGAAVNERDGKKILALIAVAVAFIVVGGFLLARHFFFAPETPQTAVDIKSILIFEKDEIIEAGKNFLNDFGKALGKNIPSGSFLNVKIKAAQEQNKIRLVSPEEFINIAKLSPPRIFIDSLGDKFMVGKFYYSDQNWPVLIFKINLYERAFPGMIKWEKTICDELPRFFSVSSVACGNKNVFEDAQINGKDARVIKNEDNSTKIIYSFVDRKYVVITTGEEPLKEILRRFASPQYFNER